MKTLEEILQYYFDCDKPFRTDGELSCKGHKAYGKLTDLLYDIGTLTGTDVEDIVETLDEITHDKF